jgi:hypothetical protein
MGGAGRGDRTGMAITRRLFYLAGLVVLILIAAFVAQGLAVIHTVNHLLHQTCGGPS